MSVINRMLQELDARHESLDTLPQPVRAVPPATPRRFPWLIGALVLIAAGLGLALWGYFSHSRPPAPKPPVSRAPLAEPQPAHPPAVPAPVPVAPAAPPAAPVADTPSVAPAPAVVEATAPPRRTVEKPVVMPAAPPPAAAGEVASPGSLKRFTPAQQAEQRYAEGLNLLAQGKAMEGEAALKEAASLDPSHGGARQALLAIYLNGRRFDEAERLLQRGLEEAGGNGRLIGRLAMALARVQLEAKGEQAALATLERYAAQGESEAAYAAFHAAVLQRLGRHGEAIAQYQAALGREPERAPWWVGLGISLEAAQRPAEAAEAFARAMALPGLSRELRAFAEQRLKALRPGRAGE
jgi:MSHA biogenesis protein MshN